MSFNNKIILLIMILIISGCSNLGKRIENTIEYESELKKTILSIDKKMQPLPTVNGNLGRLKMALYPYQDQSSELAVVVLKDPGYYNFNAKDNLDILTEDDCKREYPGTHKCRTVYKDCSLIRNMNFRVGAWGVILTAYAENLHNSTYSCPQWKDPNNFTDEQKSYLNEFIERAKQSYEIKTECLKYCD